MVLLVLFASQLSHATTVAEVSNPRDGQGWVSDMAAILGAAEISEINNSIESLHQEMGIEIAVVTVVDVDSATPKDFATKLFNTWGIGDAKSNTGLLILLVTGRRRLEMETGYGLESVLPDGWLKNMQVDIMVPAFKRGAYGQGLVLGVDAVAKRLRNHKDGVVESIEYPGGVHKKQKNNAPWVALFFGGSAASLAGGVAWARRRKTRCPKCKQKLLLLPEHEDDAKLTKGQIREEELGSVDYQYWYCTNDGYTRLDRVNKWLSDYSRCPTCGHKTRKVDRTTTVEATAHSYGKIRIVEDCKNCGRHQARTQRTPMLTLSSTGGFNSGGSSGGGGGFGGGSSGGGGSGSSW